MLFSKSGDQEAINLNKEKCYFRFYKATLKSIELSSEELLARFDKIIYSNEFLSLSEADQNEFLMMLAIQNDSSNYWENHLAEWKQLKADGVQLRGFWSNLRNAVLEVMVISFCDSNGAFVPSIQGAAGGAITGAIAGALTTGGIGAGAAAAICAFAGGVGAGVVYGVSASIEAACEEAEWSDESETEWFEPIWEGILAILDEWEETLEESEE